MDSFVVPGSSNLRNSAGLPIRLAPTGTHVNRMSCSWPRPNPIFIDYDRYTLESIRWEAAQRIIHGLSLRLH
jgi:hypothetical protein